jgi:hypothetical protein
LILITTADRQPTPSTEIYTGRDNFPARAQ